MADSKQFDPNKAMEDIKKDRNLALIAGGAAVLLVGMFLPWVSVEAAFLDYSANGFDANGWFPVILAVVAVAAALNVMNQDKKTMAIVALVASGLGALIVLLDWPDTSDTLGVVSVGLGYYLSLAGGVAMTVGSFFKFQKDSGGTTASAPAPKAEETEEKEE
ncbi:MAG: hypothetical protein R3313_02240 [Candidatus Saccharimonadales bacterium]|nr:hypothetical protein [Candidatus Saccharimonadales bacterium]